MVLAYLQILYYLSANYEFPFALTVQERFRREKEDQQELKVTYVETSSIRVKNHGTDTVHFHIFNY